MKTRLILGIVITSISVASLSLAIFVEPNTGATIGATSGLIAGVFTLRFWKNETIWH
jgi:hypothetical protein